MNVPRNLHSQLILIRVLHIRSFIVMQSEWYQTLLESQQMQDGVPADETSCKYLTLAGPEFGSGANNSASCKLINLTRHLFLQIEMWDLE